MRYRSYEAYLWTPDEGSDGRGVGGLDTLEKAVRHVKEWLAQGYEQVAVHAYYASGYDPKTGRAWDTLLDTRAGVDLVGLLGPAGAATVLVPTPRERLSALAERLAA